MLQHSAHLTDLALGLERLQALHQKLLRNTDVLRNHLVRLADQRKILLHLAYDLFIQFIHCCHLL